MALEKEFYFLFHQDLELFYINEIILVMLVRFTTCFLLCPQAMLHVERGEGKLHVTIVFLSNCSFLFFSSCLTYADLTAFGVMTLITNTTLLLYLFYFTFNLGFNASLLFKNVVSFALQCLLLLFMKNNPI